MDLARQGNLIEAGLWFVVAAVLLVAALRKERRLRGTLLALAAIIAAFGGSDLVEARTGAWWKPWWLFVWKAGCVLGMLWGFIRWHRLTKRSERAEPASKEHS